MVTGASQADAAVLIIDVQEGVREQSRRHAYILSLLGIKQVIVLLNKMDLADFSKERFAEVKEEIERFLDSINIKALFYIPVSAIKGDNIAGKSEKMDWHDGPTFLESLNMLKTGESDEYKPLIFPVQDVYKIDDKRIVVGRVEAGVIEKGCMIKILPGRQVTRVHSIEKFLKKTESACAGESIGITTEDASFITRGDILCLPEQEPVLTDRFSANVFWMAKQNFIKGERITIRCATQETTCVIEVIKRVINSSTLDVIREDGEALKNLEVGEVILRTKKPIAVKSFNDVRELGRFVLVQDENISAGGIVTDF
jgi:sulfate adenylyltransferase subunit 1 (EFTu-like GTPase family)